MLKCGARATWFLGSVSSLLLIAVGCGSNSNSGPHDGPTSTGHGSSGSNGSHAGSGAHAGSGGRASSNDDADAGSAGQAGNAAGHGSSGSGSGSGGSDATDGGSASQAGSGGKPSTAGAGGSQPPPTMPFSPAADSTYLSDTDISAGEINLSADHLSGEWLGLGTWGVRSTRSIAPQQGVFYFEAYAPLDYFDLGVATSTARLDQPAGASTNGFSIDTQGYYVVNNNLTSFTADGATTYGFVVDYRGANPIVHVISGSKGPGALVTTQMIDTITTPLFIHLSGQRRIPGMQVTINPGNDTVNQPFTLDPVAALKSSNLGDVASALVLGWGATHAGKPNAPPTLNVATANPSSIALGGMVTLTATADDAEDGSLTSAIDWEVLSEGNGPERVRGSGGSFTFKPNAIGTHPIQVIATDSGGKQAAKTITITVTGTLQQFSNVQLTLEPGLSGSGISLSPNGLQAHWTVDQKNGVRANQGLYGAFWYVEGHRLVAQANQAIGLVIGGVSLDPYHFDVTPPSCSVNTFGPGVYQDLINIDEPNVASTAEYYGFAVDYRGTSPIVYVIIDGRLTNTLNLKDVTVPIYPMLYGNVTNLGAPYDMEINFGATMFHENPSAALMTAGVSPTGLQLCWGAANANCLQH